MEDFKRGEKVEISLKEEGFSGSYFTAIVLARVGKDHFLVEYQTLCSDDGLRMLREIVPCINVRHFPPEIKFTNFSVLDKVDAYDNDGWWVGTITSKGGGGGGGGGISSEYRVYFETTGEQVTYPLSKLRVHQDWDGEKWVISNIKALKD